jgi:hypothetical protein
MKKRIEVIIKQHQRTKSQIARKSKRIISVVQQGKGYLLATANRVEDVSTPKLK